MKSHYILGAAITTALAVMTAGSLSPAKRAQGSADAPPASTVQALVPGMADLFSDEKRDAKAQEPLEQF